MLAVTMGRYHCFKVLVAHSCPTFCDPMDYSLPGSSAHGDSPSKNTGVRCCALLQGIFPTQGTEPRSPALQADSLQSEPPGKPTIVLKSLLIKGQFKCDDVYLGLGDIGVHRFVKSAMNVDP